ncbi:MAG: DNA-binding domain-containing protein [Pseudomonadota bacterium]
MQQEFTTSLLDPKAPLPEGVSDPNGKPSPKRFAVYRNNVVHSLIGALTDAYPTIRADVGAEFFEAMAGHFVRKHPPSSPMMMFYGAEMGEFLREFAPVATRPYLVDLAALEALMRGIYHSADDPVFDPATLEGMEPDALMAMRFDFRASATLFHSDHQVGSIWMYHNQNNGLPSEAGTEYMLITRPALDVGLYMLSEAQFGFFTKLRIGETLGDAFEAAQAIETEFDLGAALGIAFQTACFSHTK